MDLEDPYHLLGLIVACLAIFLSLAYVEPKIRHRRFAHNALSIFGGTLAIIFWIAVIIFYGVVTGEMYRPREGP